MTQYIRFLPSVRDVDSIAVLAQMVERKVLTLAVMDSSPIADHRCLSKMFACFNKKYAKRLDEHTKVVWSFGSLLLFMTEKSHHFALDNASYFIGPRNVVLLRWKIGTVSNIYIFAYVIVPVFHRSKGALSCADEAPCVI